MAESIRANGVDALRALAATLGPESTRDVIQEYGNLWTASFQFNPPAASRDVDALQVQLAEDFDLRLPKRYRDFLLFCNGALLYDDGYGQWGFRLYGTSDMVRRNGDWQEYYDESSGWVRAYLAFGESQGDLDLLVLDTHHLVSGGQDCRVLDGDSEEPPAEWTSTAPSFGDWLDRLVAAQGCKYWRWYPGG